MEQTHNITARNKGEFNSALLLLEDAQKGHNCGDARNISNSFEKTKELAKNLAKLPELSVTESDGEQIKLSEAVAELADMELTLSNAIFDADSKRKEADRTRDDDEDKEELEDEAGSLEGEAEQLREETSEHFLAVIHAIRDAITDFDENGESNTDVVEEAPTAMVTTQPMPEGAGKTKLLTVWSLRIGNNRDIFANKEMFDESLKKALDDAAETGNYDIEVKTHKDIDSTELSILVVGARCIKS